MSRPGGGGIWGRLVVGAGLLGSTTLVGTALGSLWVKLFVPRKAMGWDGIADALGGLMLGGLVGLLAGVILAVLLSRRAQVVGIVVGLVVTGGVFAGLAATAPKREAANSSPPPAAEPEPRP